MVEVVHGIDQGSGGYGSADLSSPSPALHRERNHRNSEGGYAV